MNEDLSNIIEQALQYASPLPVPEQTAILEADLEGWDDNLHPTFVITDTQGLKSLDVCNNSINHNTDASTSDILTSCGFGTELHISPQPLLQVSDGFHDNKNSSFNTLGSAKTDISETLNNVSNNVEIVNCDGEFVQIEITTDDSNITELQPLTTLTTLQPESASDLINETHDITNACFQFENECSGSIETTESTSSDVSESKPKVKRRRRREKNPDPPPEPVLPPCSICEEKSSGYHYGANTCEACKGFYRRTLKKKEVDYKCKCTPNEKELWKRGPLKNGCPACRYEKCLAVGMSRNAIKIGRYTINHKTKNIKEVKSMEAVDNLITALTKSPSEFSMCTVSGLDETSSTSSTVDLTELSLGTTSNPDFTEHSLITSSSPGFAEYSLVTSSTSADEPAFKRYKTPALQGQKNSSISLKEIDSLVKILTEAHSNLQIDDRAHIPTETIRKKQEEYLEKYNLQRELFGSMRRLTKDEFTEFYNATGIDIDGRLQRLDTALKYFEEKITMIVGFAKEIPGFKKLALDDQANLIKASRVESAIICTYKNMLPNCDRERKVVTTPWGKHMHLDEIEAVLPKELMMMRYKISRQLFDLNLSIQEESILRALLVVSSDRCKLDEPRKVEAIQEKLVTCLQHLVNIRPGGPGNLLYKIFSIITNMRNMSDMTLNFQKKFMMDCPTYFTSYYPLLRELLT